jgi:hypothetical protein
MIFPSLPVIKESRHGNYADTLINGVDARAAPIDWLSNAVGSGLLNLNEFGTMIVIMG